MSSVLSMLKLRYLLNVLSGDIKKAVAYISLDEVSPANWEVGLGWK